MPAKKKKAKAKKTKAKKTRRPAKKVAKPAPAPEEKPAEGAGETSA